MREEGGTHSTEGRAKEDGRHSAKRGIEARRGEEEGGWRGPGGDLAGWGRGTDLLSPSPPGGSSTIQAVWELFLLPLCPRLGTSCGDRGGHLWRPSLEAVGAVEVGEEVD